MPCSTSPPPRARREGAEETPHATAGSDRAYNHEHGRTRAAQPASPVTTTEHGKEGPMGSGLTGFLQGFMTTSQVLQQQEEERARHQAELDFKKQDWNSGGRF